MSGFLSLARLGALLMKEFIQMRRDRITFGMMLGVPLIQLLLFGYAINPDPKQLPAALVAVSQDHYTRAVVSALEATGYYRFDHVVASAAEAESLIAAGTVAFVVTIPSDLARRIDRGDRPRILIEADATDPSASSGAISALGTVVRRALTREQGIGDVAAEETASRLDVVVHRRYNPEGVSQYNIVPGLLGVILQMTMVMMTSIALTREIERGTMENLLAMPASPLEIMLGKVLPYLAVGAVQVAVVLATARLLFGIPFVGGQALIDAIVALDAAGFSGHVHASGERAVRDTLDGFEAAREANGWNTPGRHHVAHVQFVHPDDVARFAALGVTANIQALWACYEPQLRDLTAPIVGPERVGHQYPFASIHRPPLASQITDFSTSEGEHRREEGGKGANLRDLSHAAGDARPRLCAGSDWPVSTPDPWAAIHVAVNRQLPADDPDFDPEPLLLHEALTLAEALDAYTAGSAFINGRGPGDAEVTGIIEVGAVADLAATDRDPFAGPVASIHSTRNVGTWVAGRRVHG